MGKIICSPILFHSVPFRSWFCTFPLCFGSLVPRPRPAFHQLIAVWKSREGLVSLFTWAWRNQEMTKKKIQNEKNEVSRIVQPTKSSTLGVYDSHPLLATCSTTWSLKIKVLALLLAFNLSLCSVCVASFPGRSHLQYLIARSMQIWRGRPWIFSQVWLRPVDRG